MSNTTKYTTEQIWEFLSEIPDPEIPVINIVELGVLRKVEISNNSIIVSITPTYSGCPAMKAFEDDIKTKLKEKGITNFEINTIHSPAWTTDWINEEALLKLKNYGIAPPIKGTEDKGTLFGSDLKTVQCPQCNSKNTSLTSQFGSTACKALYQCKDCLEPFDYFKCI
ncbi:MAG: phenylacetate-CoA oxygenase subunit PaaJ [Flavobacteriales bacterium]|nr:phenylacetate-CoA oxygenase subunit PaaJ [Flavobacteriales bacterium]